MYRVNHTKTTTCEHFARMPYKAFCLNARYSRLAFAIENWKSHQTSNLHNLSFPNKTLYRAFSAVLPIFASRATAIFRAKKNEKSPLLTTLFVGKKSHERSRLRTRENGPWKKEDDHRIRMPAPSRLDENRAHLSQGRAAKTARAG